MLNRWLLKPYPDTCGIGFFFLVAGRHVANCQQP